MHPVHVDQFRQVWMEPFHLPQEHYPEDLDGEVAITMEDTFVVWADEDGRVWELFIKVGFLHDGASVPKSARWFLNKWGPSIYGALPHDWLYRTKGGSAIGLGNFGTLLCEDVPATLGRKAADQVMREGFRLTYKAWRADWAYRMVRLRGKRHWGGPVPCL